MSAFMCSDDHLNYLVTAYAMLARSTDVEWLQKKLDYLCLQNNRSVNHRYGELTPVEAVKFRLSPALKVVTLKDNVPELVKVLKQIACYEYQACETSDFQETEAAVFCHELRRLACHALPGYQDAPWGLA